MTVEAVAAITATPVWFTVGTRRSVVASAVGGVMNEHRGFTLIEIAIVLVIIGLLLGGILKGQELITSARVRNLIAQQEGIKAAYFGFLDRYRALPGDYANASTSINGVGAGANGNGNGQITPTGVAGATIDEHIAAWEHLSRSGFINGSYTFAPGAGETPTSAPTNAYARYLQLIYDGIYGAGVAATPSPLRHNLKTGNQVPSDMLAEIDRKTDDGLATSGSFQFSEYGGGAGGAVVVGPGNCYAAVAPATWAAQPPVPNCGAAALF
jgi:prepilin-type N-terminal cleavage/methylation domain-containing protein